MTVGTPMTPARGTPTRCRRPGCNRLKSYLRVTATAAMRSQAMQCLVKRARHNKAYWTGRPYLGLGTQASSMLTLKGYLRLRGLARQLPEPPRGMARVRLTMTSERGRLAQAPSLADQPFSLEFLDEAQAAAEDLMLGARLVEGLGPRASRPRAGSASDGRTRRLPGGAPRGRPAVGAGRPPCPHGVRLASGQRTLRAALGPRPRQGRICGLRSLRRSSPALLWHPSH